MIKKLILLSAVCFSSVLGYSQCTPSPIYTDSLPGIWPDSVSNLPLAFDFASGGYNAVIDIKTITAMTLTYQGTEYPVQVESIRILDATGLPPGFVVAPSYSTPPAWTNGGVYPNFTSTQGCILIAAPQSAVQAACYGGPNNNGVFPIVLWFDAYVKGDSFPANYTWLSDIGNEPYGSAIAYSPYIIRVLCDYGSVEETLSSTRFDVTANYPNPFTNVTNINYNTLKAENVTMKVYNMLGGLVYSKQQQSVQGKNIIEFDGSKLSAGMYIYTVSNGAETITRKMTIN